MEDKQVIQKLLEYADKLYEEGKKKKLQYIPDNPEANKLIMEDKNAYLFGVLFDWGQKAERAWEHPYSLKKKLGHLDVEKISKMWLTDLVDIFRRKTRLRMPAQSACFTLYASQLLVRKYEGNAENIWDSIDDGDLLLRRLNEFYGIGQKKASMVLNALVRDFDHEIKDKSLIDISYDRHIKKVFLRSGLVDKIDEETIIQKAKEANPDYPGKLDLPCWMIGRQWCEPANPNCDSCILNDSCKKAHLEITDFD